MLLVLLAVPLILLRSLHDLLIERFRIAVSEDNIAHEANLHNIGQHRDLNGNLLQDFSLLIVQKLIKLIVIEFYEAPVQELAILLHILDDNVGQQILGRVFRVGHIEIGVAVHHLDAGLSQEFFHILARAQ